MIEPLYGYLYLNDDIADDILDKLLQYNLFNPDEDRPVKTREDYGDADYIFINYKEIERFYESDFIPDDKEEFNAILHFNILYHYIDDIEYDYYIEIIKSDYIIKCDNYKDMGNINSDGDVWTYCLPPELVPWLKDRIVKTNDMTNLGD